MSLIETLLNKQKDASVFFLDFMTKTLSFGIAVQEDIKAFLENIKSKTGEGAEGKEMVKDMADHLSQKGDELMSDMFQIVDRTLEKLNIPTKNEVDKLQRKVQSLSAKLKKMEDPESKDAE